jgi:glycosyltransferase involved in cell wall biosynthesis
VNSDQRVRPSSLMPSLAILPWGDRFEDFYDKIGVSLETFCEELTGTWLFNYVRAFHTAGVRPVLYFASAHVREPLRSTHRTTGTPVRVMPAPWLHRKLQGARDRLRLRSPLYRSLLSYAATPWRAFARGMRDDRCEAILCQEYEYPRFDGAVLLGRILRLPVFATYQAGNRPGSALEVIPRRVTVARADGLIIASRTEWQRVRDTYAVEPERLAVVPNALDVVEWSPQDRADARRRVGIPPDRPVVVWHGRVSIHQKGLDVLLDAWARVCSAASATPPLLLMVGRGQDHAAIHQRIAALPAGTVRWEARWVQDPALLRTYLAAADVATLSSRHEGFAVAVIEAMACGLPVVATDVSGVVDALGEEPAGAIVPPEDPAALAQAIRQLIDDEPRRRALGRRARERAEREFSLERVGARLRAFMEARGAFRAPQIAGVAG